MRPLDNRAFALIAGLVLILACGMVFLAAAPQSAIAPDKAASSAPTSEEYEVVSAFLQDDSDSHLPSLIVIEANTAKDFTSSNDPKEKEQELAFLKRSLEVDDGFISEYFRSNAAPSKWDNNFSLPSEVRLLSEEDFHKYFGDRGSWWEGFYRDFPGSGGLLGFSRVAFNTDHTLALFYASHTCGGLCGTGHYVLMKKVNGAWKVSKSAMSWIS